MICKFFRVVVCSFMSFVPLAVFAEHLPITNELITMVEHDRSLKNMLMESIKLAKKSNPDLKTNPAQTLTAYYDFLDYAATALPWKVLPKAGLKGLYDEMSQGLDYFYFINDQPLPELKNKGYYYNALQYHEPYRSWMIQFTIEYANFLDTPASWTPEALKMAQEDPRFGLQNDWYEDPSHWKTFNEFFVRHLKSPAARPIASPDDASVITSPADSIPQGIWNIDSDSKILTNGARIKSKTFESIPDLLGPDSAYQNAFAGGTLTHTFLDVNDYHRYHFPISGTIREIRIIEQDDAAGGITTWDSKAHRYVLTSKTPGWQSIETRGLVILETEKYGLVALLPVGMSQVSSVKFEENLKVGTKVKKGDMFGCFLFGGSDVIMLFQKQVQLDLVAPQKKDAYSHILMGEKYGKISLKK